MTLQEQWDNSRDALPYRAQIIILFNENIFKASYSCSQNMTNTMRKCIVSVPTKANKNFRVYLRMNEKSITVTMLN